MDMEPQEWWPYCTMKRFCDTYSLLSTPVILCLKLTELQKSVEILVPCTRVNGRQGPLQNTLTL